VAADQSSYTGQFLRKVLPNYPDEASRVAPARVSAGSQGTSKATGSPRKSAAATRGSAVKKTTAPVRKATKNATTARKATTKTANSSARKSAAKGTKTAKTATASRSGRR
jgi:hypothetical protein